MAYIKGLLAGTLTLLLSIVVYVVVWSWYMFRRSADSMPSGAEVGIDLSAFLYSPIFWLVAVLGFALGFVWAFRTGS
jgi:hypothetical protein